MAPRLPVGRMLGGQQLTDPGLQRIITSDEGADDFISNHVWVPIVGCALGLIVIIIIGYCIWRCRFYSRYDYSVLKDDLELPQKLEMERKLQRDTMRETALLHCQFYIRSSGLYILLQHLPEIGSRAGKHWFTVRDVRSKTEKLLTMLPRGAQMLLPFNLNTRRTLLDLLLSLQHPYLYPIYDLDMLTEQDRVVVIRPFNTNGSLKDVIHRSQCKQSYDIKYSVAGTGLGVSQLAMYGRQILEALLYLQQCGMPPYGHLHSGNVIVENNTCRLTGFENEFLGLTPKLYGLATRRLKADKVAVDTVCFGHLLYEMTMGAELDCTVPMLHHLVAVGNSSVQEVLEFIFTDSGNGFPSLEEIAGHPFFKSVPLRELQVFKPAPVKFTKNMKAILKSMKKGRLLGQRKAHVKTFNPAKDTGSRTKTSRISPHLEAEVPTPTVRVRPSPTSQLGTKIPAKPLLPPRPSKAPPVRPYATERTALLNEIKRGTPLKPTGRAHPRV